MKICGITTKAITIKAFMLGNLNFMTMSGHKAYCICQPDDSLAKLAKENNVAFIPVDLKWGNVSPLELCRNIYDLYKIFKKEKFDVIQYATSNAGLYACIAGCLARVPVRIYCQWGISYTDFAGLKLWFYKFMEKLTCWCSTSVQPDSFSNLKFGKEERLYNPVKGCVLYNGSACGVDLTKFDVLKRDIWKSEVLEELHISNYSRIFGFVGRIVKEKGIGELIAAFKKLNAPNSYLILVGAMDENSRIDEDLMKWANEQPNVIFTGPKSNPVRYFAAFDFMILPSYREGFGMTVLEAAAMRTPSIITNIKGPTDFVKHGYNGLVCELKSVNSLCDTLRKGINMSDESYNKLAQTSYQVVIEQFDSTNYKIKFKENREELLKKLANNGYT